MDDCIIVTGEYKQLIPETKPINPDESHLVYKIRLSHRRGQHTLTNQLLKRLSRVEQEAIRKLLGIR